MMWGFYSMLGVPRGSSQQEFDDAWRELSRAKHPDVFQAQGLEGEALAKVTEEFARLTEARSFTKSAEDRRRYNAWLDLFGSRCVRCAGKGTILKGLDGRRRTCPECSGHGAMAVVVSGKGGRS